MLMWIEKVLKPYVATTPTGIVPFLFLDSYQVNIMASVNTAINYLGLEVIIIPPPGCTGIMQPAGIGYNKPFKNHVRNHYEEWMMEKNRDLTVPSSHQVDVARWVVAADKTMTTDILQNA
jgi:hypothetical protein